MQIELLLEEASAAAALQIVVPALLPDCVCRIRTFQGCRDLLSQLPHILPTYRRRMAQSGQEDLRLVVMLDADGIGSRRLAELEGYAVAAGLSTYATVPAGSPFSVFNCLTEQELEAWFLGDAVALQLAYPSLKPNLVNQLRGNPDILPKPNEMLWHLLRQARYFLNVSSKPKTLWAATIAPHLDPTRNSSPSFQYFCQGLAALQ